MKCRSHCGTRVKLQVNFPANLTAKLWTVEMSNCEIILEGAEGEPEQRLEILEIHERPGKFKRALPALPLPLAIIFCIINFVLPGFGTIFAGTYARLSSRDTEQVRILSSTGAAMTSSATNNAQTNDSPIIQAPPVPPLTKQEKFSLNIGAGILQLLGTPIFLVGWIWSINWGIVLISLSMQKRMETAKNTGEAESNNASLLAETGKT
ncbi:unnamed protein product [Notodromas monacha]|uniref:Transmembrane protein n=1 Tax=Notodromas monacha TaxID=399045 RepID=A0A7R9BKR0_9CRUS|nr:unnamed protein product [Notodromas monacha]CAG0917023.1 unnamed protein product [Notodromas monacha]